jgi:hypothetical protein
MTDIISGNTTGIDTDLSFMYRLEFFFLSGECIVQLYRHGTSRKRLEGLEV